MGARRETGVRELARRLGRDVRRVHADVCVLAELGLVERTASGGLLCPFADIHIDMHVSARRVNEPLVGSGAEKESG